MAAGTRVSAADGDIAIAVVFAVVVVAGFCVGVNNRVVGIGIGTRVTNPTSQ